jgi:hypothetical protein
MHKGILNVVRIRVTIIIHCYQKQTDSRFFPLTILIYTKGPSPKFTFGMINIVALYTDTSHQDRNRTVEIHGHPKEKEEMRTKED